MIARWSKEKGQDMAVASLQFFVAPVKRIRQAAMRPD